MGPLMYRHRPSYAALIAAVVILIFGIGISYCLKQRVDAGEGTSSSIALVLCVSIVLAGIFLIIAFARYKFTHLKTDRAFTKKKYR